MGHVQVKAGVICQIGQGFNRLVQVRVGILHDKRLRKSDM